MDNQQQALVNTYLNVGRRVNETLRIQNGSVVRLRAQQDEVRAFAANANRVRHLSWPYIIYSQLSGTGSELIK